MSNFYFALLFFFLGFFVRSIFFYSYSILKYAEFMKDIELKFLLLTSNYIQWRAQALEILKLSYKFSETEESEEKEMHKKMLEKVEEKYDEVIEQYIKELKNILPYNTGYDNLDGVKKEIANFSRNKMNE